MTKHSGDWPMDGPTYHAAHDYLDSKHQEIVQTNMELKLVEWWQDHVIAHMHDKEIKGPYLGDPDLIDLYYHNGWTLILWDHSDMGEGLYLDAGNWFDAVKEVIDKLGLINEVEKIHWDFTE